MNSTKQFPFKRARRITEGEVKLAQQALEKATLADESSVIKNLENRYSRAGVCLQGARFKEGLSQVELAEKLGTIQANISAMEHGKRPIGKVMAKRLSKVLHIDYRLFL